MNSIFSACIPYYAHQAYARQMLDKSCMKCLWLITLSSAVCALSLITTLKLAYWEEKNWM